MEYLYKIKDASGKVQQAVAHADSPNSLRARLEARGVDVVEIKPRQKSAKNLAQMDVGELFKHLFERITARDMVVFGRQFSAMVSSDVGMLRTLSIIVEQCQNSKLKKTVDDVRLSIESGLSLSDSLSRHPKVFDRLYISMVRAGEAGGFLAEALRRVADFQESRQRLSQKVSTAMVYPSVVLAVAVLVFWGMLTFILPIFQNLFKSIGGELPAYTKFLISLSGYVRSPWAAVFVLIAGVSVYLLRRYYATDRGKRMIDGAILDTPVMGDLVRKVAVARFSRTFGTLLKAGVPMLSALDVVKETTGNAIVSKGVETIYTEVRQGGSLSKPMLKLKVFPPMVTQMIAVGEETGRLDDMLFRIADFYDMEVENAVEGLTAMLEPIMVVGVGAIVGSVVIGLYLPIFTIINQLH